MIDQNVLINRLEDILGDLMYASSYVDNGFVDDAKTKIRELIEEVKR
jgi:hypothetical protein